MNKQRFIESINLHLDNELTPEESEELMAVARSNPEYYRIYRQYCMINEACARLGGDFASPKTRSSARQTIYAMGGMAAAAALLFMAGRNLAPMVGEDAVAAQGAVPVAPAAAPQKGLEQLAVFDVDSVIGARAFDRSRAERGAGDYQFARFTVGDEDARFPDWRSQYAFPQPVSTDGFERALEISDVPRAFDALYADFSEATPAYTAASPRWGAPQRAAYFNAGNSNPPVVGAAQSSVAVGNR